MTVKKQTENKIDTKVKIHFKNFDVWNSVKKEINNKSLLPNVHEREIWWCSIGINIGFEEDGKNDTFERPVLVIKKFNKDLCFAVPLSTKNHNNKYYFEIKSESFAILSQAKPISTKRMQRYISKIGANKFELLKKDLTKALIQEVEIPLARDFSGA